MNVQWNDRFILRQKIASGLGTLYSVCDEYSVLSNNPRRIPLDTSILENVRPQYGSSQWGIKQKYGR